MLLWQVHSPDAQKTFSDVRLIRAYGEVSPFSYLQCILGSPSKLFTAHLPFFFCSLTLPDPSWCAFIQGPSSLQEPLSGRVSQTLFFCKSDAEQVKCAPWAHGGAHQPAFFLTFSESSELFFMTSMGPTFLEFIG